MAVASAAGIPAALLDADSPGTAQREAWRRFFMGSVEPLSKMLAETAGEALDAEISFSYASTHAHDVTGRSSAMAKLVSAGMSLADAQKLVGLSVCWPIPGVPFPSGGRRRRSWGILGLRFRTQPPALPPGRRFVRVGGILPYPVCARLLGVK